MPLYNPYITALSAGTTVALGPSVVFSNVNGVSFGGNGSTVTGSVAAGATATGNLGAIAAGTQTATSGTIVFSNSNGITFGLSGSTRVTASHNGITAGIQSISAGTTRATSGELVFADSNGVSFGVNGQTITADVTNNEPYQHIPWQGSVNFNQLGNNTLFVMPALFRGPHTVHAASIYPIINNSTNSVGTVSLSFWYGFYTLNGATFSAATTSSYSTQATYSGTTNNSTFAGFRVLSLPISAAIGSADVWFAFVSRTSTGGNNASVSHLCISQANLTFSGSFGVATNASHQMYNGYGIWSNTTTGAPNAIEQAHVQVVGNVIWRSHPYIAFGRTS